MGSACSKLLCTILLVSCHLGNVDMASAGGKDKGKSSGDQNKQKSRAASPLHSAASGYGSSVSNQQSGYGASSASNQQSGYGSSSSNQKSGYDATPTFQMSPIANTNTNEKYWEPPSFTPPKLPSPPAQRRSPPPPAPYTPPVDDQSMGGRPWDEKHYGNRRSPSPRLGSEPRTHGGMTISWPITDSKKKP